MKSLDDHREDLIGDLLRRASRPITAPVQRSPKDCPAYHRGRDLWPDLPASRLLRRRLHLSQPELVELALHPRLDEGPELPVRPRASRVEPCEIVAGRKY